MTTVDVLVRAWAWEPSILSGCALLLGLYLGLARPLTWRALAFVAGLLVLLLSLVSPIAVLADTYLFSAHMVQHLLLLLAAPPLLLLGLPPRLVERVLAVAPVGRALRVLAVAPVGRALRVLAHPLLAWAAYNLLTWVWHLPAIYDASLRQAGLHITGHLLFVATSTLFWWPVLGPAGPAHRPLAPWTAMLYLAAAAVSSTVLGILLTFAPPGLYPTYWQPADPLGIRPLLRDEWGLAPADDQQLGGLLMWIPGGLAYSAAILAILARWLSEPEANAEYRATSTEYRVPRPE